MKRSSNYATHSLHTVVTLPHAEPAPKTKIQEVDVLQLPDGTLLETITDPENPGYTALAAFQNGQTTVVRQFPFEDRMLVPLADSAPGIRHITFADGTSVCESPRDLLESGIEFLNRVLELSPESSILLSAFAFSTWFVDLLPVAPYVAFVGPPGSGKTTALLALKMLCRRSLATSDISSAAFYDLCENVGPTLLIDEATTLTNRRQMDHILRTGSTKGFVTLRRNGSFRSFGARAFSSKDLPDDEALNSRCLIIPMKCSARKNLLSPFDPGVMASAKEARRQFLHYRLANYGKLTGPRANDAQFALSPRSRDLFRSLALPFGRYPGLPDLLVTCLMQQDQFRPVLNPIQAAVINSLFEILHGRGRNQYFEIGLSEIRALVNGRLQVQGEHGLKSEKGLGGVLTALGLTDRQRRNNGYALRLTLRSREQIHALHRTHRLVTQLTSADLKRCRFCNPQLQPTAATSAADLFLRRPTGEHCELGERQNQARQGQKSGRIFANLDACQRRLNRPNS